jgi:hypothetical protein
LVECLSGAAEAFLELAAVVAVAVVAAAAVGDCCGGSAFENDLPSFDLKPI